MKMVIKSFFILFILGWIQTALASDPVSLLQSLADRMIAGLKENQASLKTNPSIAYSLAYKIIVPHADLAEMAKRVLPPQSWNNATSNQRVEFEKEFTRLLVRTYASALSDYTNQTIKFYPVRSGSGSTVTVNSKIIRNDGPPVSVDYRLIEKGSGWKLFDMSVEGVSVIESFRSQFAEKLSQGDMNALLRDLKQHNER